MQSFSPNPKKIGEQILLFGILTVAAGSFAVSYIPGMPSPSFFQLLSFLLLTAAVLLITNCLLKSYRYDFVLRERCDDSTRVDLEITEMLGKKQTVVCRVSVEDICACCRLDEKNFRALKKGKRCYNYSGNLFFKNHLLLTVQDDEELFYLILTFDESFLQKLQSLCPNLFG